MYFNKISSSILGNIRSSAQTDSRDVYGWLRYDDYNQDEYGICKFKTDAAVDSEGLKFILLKEGKDTGITFRAVPVSYTHLDVYKRQIIFSVILRI